MSRYYPPVTVTGNPVNFSAPNGGKLDSVSVQIIPTQDLHGYDHPWPAGGGVNKFDGLWNGASSGWNYATNYIPITAGESYFLGTPNLTSGYMFIEWCDSEKTFLSSGNARNGTVTAPTGASFARLKAWYDINVTDVSFNYPSTVTTYSPYSNICPISGLTGLSVYVGPTQDQEDATEYAVDWSTQAGTVYGGTVDVVTGLLTVDMAMVDLGTLNWIYRGNGVFTSVGVAGYSKRNSDICYCSAYKGVSAGAFSNLVDKSVQCGNSYFAANAINIKDTAYSDAAIFKTAVSGVQLCYELATPLTYQLTPKQIAALIDQNYIWSSNNETISVVYALLVPGSDKYTLIVNGVDIADFVERDSYRTTLYPVFSEAVQTLDGVGHTALLRKKGELSARFNPRTAADTAIICAALLNAPCEVQYHCLQRNADVTALMTIDSVSALYLSRCLYCRQKWNDIDSITLTEL